jgi:hypothetical protein
LLLGKFRRFALMQNYCVAYEAGSKYNLLKLRRNELNRTVWHVACCIHNQNGYLRSIWEIPAFVHFTEKTTTTAMLVVGTSRRTM